jgi:carboxyl-terminal processing protease
MVEVLSAGAPSRPGRWSGPVAALVDQRTASAAEMIAGALDHYGRGPAVGALTFGKGCIQEYFDDATGAGVLRLTTLLFALPDGVALQRVGLEPRVRLELPGLEAKPERESDLKGAMPTQAGPDIRAAAWLGGPGWPDHHGHVGPCSDPTVCAALRRIGGYASAVRRDSAVRRRSPGGR